MLRYLGNNKYETYLEDGTKIEVSVNDLENIVRDVKEAGKEFNHESSDRLYEATKCKVSEEVWEELEEYTSSLDDDANTLDNFDKGCCDEKEQEVLRNVFDWLDTFIKKHNVVES